MFGHLSQRKRRGIIPKGQRDAVYRAAHRSDSDVFSIIVDPANPSVVYASACSGIYRSENGAALFQKVNGMPFTARRTDRIRIFFPSSFIPPIPRWFTPAHVRAFIAAKTARHYSKRSTGCRLPRGAPIGFGFFFHHRLSRQSLGGLRQRMFGHLSQRKRRGIIPKGQRDAVYRAAH